MAGDVTMPRLSDSMEEGTVLKWLVDEGGEVKRGEPLVEIETDKANMTYDADSDGVLVEIVAQEGDTLAIGEVIARIGEAGEAKSGGGEEESSGDEAEGGEEGEAEASAEESAEEAEEEGAEDAEPAKAEADAEAEGAAEAEGTDDAAAAGDEEGETAVAGAEGGGGETQAAAGTATRERPSGGHGDGRVKASPVARRMARDLGVEL